MKRKYLQYAFHAAALVGIAWAGVKYIDSAEFWSGLRRFQWGYAPLILALTVAYTVVKGWRFAFLLRQSKPYAPWTLMKGWWAGQPHALLPGGTLARAGIMEQAGVPAAESMAAITHASLADQATLLLGAMVAAFWFESARMPLFILLGVLTAVSVLLGIQAVRTWLLKTVEWLLGKLKLAGLWRKFLDSMQEMTSPKLLIGGLLNTVAAFALMIVALDLTLRGVDARVPWSVLLLAFALPNLLGRISALPGGVGVTEAGMVGVLDAAPGVSASQAAAAVAVFRVGTVFFAALLGGLVYFFAWRGKAEKTMQADGPEANANSEGADNAERGQAPVPAGAAEVSR